jgi:hypothetical protein
LTCIKINDIRCLYMELINSSCIDFVSFENYKNIMAKS